MYFPASNHPLLKCQTGQLLFVAFANKRAIAFTRASRSDTHAASVHGTAVFALAIPPGGTGRGELLVRYALTSFCAS